MRIGVIGAIAVALSVISQVISPPAAVAAAAGGYGYVGSFGEEGSGSGQFAKPQRLAVDPNTGDVFVADTLNGRVDVFAPTATGASFLTSFGAGDLSEPAGVAVDPSTGAVYVSDAGSQKIVKFDETVGAPPTFAVDASFTSPAHGAGAEEIGSFGEWTVLGGSASSQDGVGVGGIAVDPTAGGEAGDGTLGTHDLLVADPANKRVERFDSKGKYLGSFDGASSGAAFTRPADLAVDGSGQIYAADLTADGGARLLRFAGTCTAPTGPCPSPTALALPNQGTANVGVVLGANPAAEEAFASSKSGEFPYLPGVVDRFGSDVTPIEELQPRVAKEMVYTFGVAAPPAAAGFHPRVYVMAAEFNLNFGRQAPAAHKIQVFELLEPPAVALESPDPIAATEATLHGSVNPNEIAVTACHFEYIAEAAYRRNLAESKPGFAGAATAACEPAPGSGSTAVHVHATASGLEPKTTYEVRLVAANAIGLTAASAPEAFASAAAPPTAVTEAPWPLLDTSATLTATVNPNATEVTHCHFAYGAAGEGLTHTAPCLPAPGAGRAPIRVTAALTGLRPETSYRYQVVAANSVGAGKGAELTFTTYPSHAGESSCPNAPFRVGPSAGLAECRAYELVTTAPKKDAEAMSPSLNFFNFGLVAATGDRVEWDDRGAVPNPLPTNGLRNSYAAGRDAAAGWAPESLTPSGTGGATEIEVVAASRDLGAFVLRDATYDQDTAEKHFDGYFYRAPDGSAALVTATEPDSSGTTQGSSVVQLSPDGGRVFLTARNHLLPAANNAAGSHELYEWSPGGGLRLAGLDSAGNPLSPCGAALASVRRQDISDDGSRVVLQSPDPRMEGAEPPAACRFGLPDSHGRNAYVSDLYLREGGRTVDISAPPPGTTDYGAAFVGMTPSGSQVFFVTETALPDDDPHTAEKHTEGLGHADLYRYDTASGRLTRLSVGPEGSDDAGLTTLGSGSLEFSALASADGSTAYFTAAGQLVVGAGRSRAENGGTTANLYRWHEGEGVRFIATIAKGAPLLSHRMEATSNPLLEPNAIAPDGSAVVFTTATSLTGYRNEGAPELYVYDARTAQISCVSCAPDGTPPTGGSTPVLGTYFFYGSGTLPVSLIGGLGADGSTVVFSSTDQLLSTVTNEFLPTQPSRENGISNVYAWHDGKLSLLSTGASPSSDLLIGASASGNDVFFLTQEPLVPQDGDHAYDIYDARVDGGFPTPAPPAPACAGDDCRAASPEPVATPAAGSASFSGPGNARAHRRARRHKKVTQARRKHHRRHARHRAGRGRRGHARHRAGRSRRGGRR